MSSESYSPTLKSELKYEAKRIKCWQKYYKEMGGLAIRACQATSKKTNKTLVEFLVV